MSSRDRALGFFISISLGLTLAYSLLPSIHSFYELVSSWIPLPLAAQNKLFEMSFFPFVSALFYLSIPKRARISSGSSTPWLKVLPSFYIPLLIAFIFGWVQRSHFSVKVESPTQELFWFLLCIPLGEELLFRGWLWSLFTALFKEKFFTLTNPLPSQLVFTSLTFSLWHLQNMHHVSFAFLSFQLLYTLLTGLWLGYLRWRTNKILVSTMAHALINLTASLPMLL
jgi:membrane protease YdiL (CAAX protease family)